MNLFVNDIVESISDSFTSGEKFQITNLKTISGNLHATITNIRDKNSIIKPKVVFNAIG